MLVESLLVLTLLPTLAGEPMPENVPCVPANHGAGEAAVPLYHRVSAGLSAAGSWGWQREHLIQCVGLSDAELVAVREAQLELARRHSCPSAESESQAISWSASTRADMAAFLDTYARLVTRLDEESGAALKRYVEAAPTVSFKGASGELPTDARELYAWFDGEWKQPVKPGAGP